MNPDREKQVASIETLEGICKDYGFTFYEMHDFITSIRKADYDASFNPNSQSSPDMEKELRENEWQKCPVCNGSGIVSPVLYTSPIGAGYSNSTVTTCRTCNGKGIILKPEPKEII